MADFKRDSGEWRYTFFGPLADNLWGMFWSGWIAAAIIGLSFEETRLILVGVIAIVILWYRGSLGLCVANY